MNVQEQLDGPLVKRLTSPELIHFSQPLKSPLPTLISMEFVFLLMISCFELGLDLALSSRGLF